MQITAKRIFAYTPLFHFNVPTNLGSPPGRIQCFIYLFSQHPTYIYTLCTSLLSNPVGTRIPFSLLLFLFQCFRCNCGRTIAPDVFFFLVRDRNPAAGDANKSPILYTWRHKLCQCVRETEGGLVSLKELKWSPVLQKNEIFSWKEKKFLSVSCDTTTGGCQNKNPTLA